VKSANAKVSQGIKNSLNLLGAQARNKLYRLTLLQSFFAVLDLAAVVIVGVIGSMAVLGIQSKESRFASVLGFLRIEELSFQQQVAFLSIMASFLLITKTAISAFLVWRSTRYYSYLAVSISESLIEKFLMQPINRISSKSTQQSLYNLISGVDSIVVGVVRNLSYLVSDSVLIVLMMITLFIADPLMAILAMSLFGFVGIALHFLVGTKSRKIAEDLVPKNIELNENILSTIEGYRESFVNNQLGHRQIQILEAMKKRANLSFRQNYLPYVSKFIIEIVLVLSIVLISATQFLFKDVVDSASILGLFLAASSRIAPAALRIQQGVSSVLSGLGAGQATLELNESLEFYVKQSEFFRKSITNLDTAYLETMPAIQFDNVSFSYRNDIGLLENIKFEIHQGERVLLLGKSGEGKSTIIDLMLGLLIPDSGSVFLLGNSPRNLIRNYPNQVSYMPQHPFLFHGTLRENIVGGVINDSDYLIWKALETVQMKEFVEKIPGQLDSIIMENGKNLSGGQRQRLCLAKALLTESQILILDEATSAIDPETESKIMKQILLNKKIKTLVVATHKISDVERFDKVGVVEKGSFRFKNNPLP
jgi:ABC-type multidrug transport system fused ATPase/permease subunit